MQCDACGAIIGTALIAGKQFAKLQRITVLCIPLQGTQGTVTNGSPYADSIYLITELG